MYLGSQTLLHMPYFLFWTLLATLVLIPLVLALRTFAQSLQNTLLSAQLPTTQALTQLTARAAAAEAICKLLLEENRVLRELQFQRAPDPGREFLESQISRMTEALGSQADLANARIMSLVNLQAAAQVHSQQIDKSPTLRATQDLRHPDRFTEEAPSSFSEPVDIPQDRPRRPGEAEILLPRIPGFDREDNTPYTPEEELAGVGLNPES